MDEFITVSTNNGPIELTQKAWELNLEISEVRDFVRAQLRRAAVAASFEEVEEAVAAAAANIAYIAELEAALAVENAK